MGQILYRIQTVAVAVFIPTNINSSNKTIQCINSYAAVSSILPFLHFNIVKKLHI